MRRSGFVKEALFENRITVVRRLRQTLKLLLASAVMVLAVSPLRAFSETGERIIAVTVRGNKTVAKETILARAQTKPGSEYDDRILSEDIRRLFALGYFTDVQLDLQKGTEGVTLTFVVQEKPSVGTIHIEGNRHIATPKILALLEVSEGQLYDPRKVKKGIDSITAEYHRKGYSEAKVVYRDAENSYENTTDLYLLIDESARMRINEVLIEGNLAFSDKNILKLLKTKAKRWWLFRAGTFNEQEAEADLERIKAFYRKNGYQDAQASFETYRAPNANGMLVHFKIEEGMQHRVGTVALEGVRLFPERDRDLYGIGLYATFVHWDTRGLLGEPAPARWTA